MTPPRAAAYALLASHLPGALGSQLGGDSSECLPMSSSLLTGRQDETVGFSETRRGHDETESVPGCVGAAGAPHRVHTTVFSPFTPLETFWAETAGGDGAFFWARVSLVVFPGSPAPGGHAWDCRWRRSSPS